MRPAWGACGALSARGSITGAGLVEANARVHGGDQAVGEETNDDDGPSAKQEASEVAIGEGMAVHLHRRCRE